MSFKLKSPLLSNPFKEQVDKIVAKQSKRVSDYKPGPKANPTYGTAKNLKEADLKEKGQRTNLPVKKAKPTEKAKSNLPANQGGGSPFNTNIASLILNATSNKKSGLSSLLPNSYQAQGPGGRGLAVSGGPEKVAATPGKGSGVIPDLLPAALKPDNNIMVTNAGKNNDESIKNTKPKNTNPSTGTSTNKKSTTLSAGSNDNEDKSGGYLKDTKNFSLGGDTKLNVAPMPKFERTVTNARSADYDMIRAKGRGKIDRLKTRLDKREGRVANRVEASSMRIKSRQQRSGERYASKMEARTNTGTNEKSMDSPKPTAASSKSKASTPKGNKVMQNQSTKVEKSSLGIDKNYKAPKGTVKKAATPPKPKLKTNAATTVSANSKTPKLRVLGAKDQKSLNKSSKKATKKSNKDNKRSKKSLTSTAMGGKKVKASTYENLTGFKPKPGFGAALDAGKPNTSIKRDDLSKGPRA